MVPDDVLVETTCDGGVLGTCNPNEMKRAVRVKICDESTPPAPVDVTVTRCGGATDLVSSTDAPSTQVIINGTTEPLPVCVVGDKDFAEVYKCDANTGNTILIRTVLDHDTSAFVTTYFDLVLGATWIGNPATDLTECQSNALESDQIIGCDGGVAVTQWIVKDNGQPTGVVYYTDVTGAVVTPVAWTPGACVTAEVTRSVDVIDDCAGTVTSETVANRIQEVIINGSEKPIDVRIKESCVTESRVDVEYFKFCDDGNTNANFIRRVERTYSVAGALLSETIVDTETDLTTPYVVVGNAVVCQPENPVDFEQRCVQDSSPTPIKGIELRERLADGTYAVVGYVESDGITAWTPVAPITDCVDTFARTICTSTTTETAVIQGNINFTDVIGGIAPGMTDAAPFLTTPADANALDGVSTQLNIALTTVDSFNFSDGEQYISITSNGGINVAMSTQWVEATDPTGSTFQTDLTNELITVLPLINVNATPTVTITSVTSPILNYDLQFVYGPSADTVDNLQSTNNTHNINVNNQTQINWDFVLPFTPAITDTLISVTFEYAGSQSSIINNDNMVIAGGLIGTNYGVLSNPTPYVIAPALGAGIVQTVSYTMTAAVDGITWADIATKFSGWSYMGQSENIQMLVDGMRATVNYTTQGGLEDAYKTTGCNDDRRDGFLETLATTSLTATNTLRSESHNYIQVDSFGNYTGNLVTETRTYNNNGSLNSVVYTDTVSGSVVSLNGSTTQLAPVTGSDFESIVMCDGTETFIRTIGYMPGGDITFTNDRLADGTAYTPVGPVTIGSCDTGSVGTTPVELCVVEQSTIALNLIPAVAGNVVTVTLDTTGTTTAITNEVVDFGDGSVSISPVHSYDYSLVADGSYIINARVIDSNGASLIQAVAVTVTGGVPVLGTLPAAKTITYDVQVAKVFRSFDGSGTVLWTVDENGVAFTPGVGQTVVPCDSCGCNEKPCESFCFSSEPTNGTSGLVVTNLTKTVQRLSIPYTVVTNYSSATVTSISADVTIDGTPVPAGFTWSVDSSTNQIFTDTVSITGTDYIVTEVR